MEIKKNQTILDFATQYGGAVDELFNVAVANGVGITDDVAPGTELKVTPVALSVTKYFEGTVMDINSNDLVPPMPGGIGYMQIETDFIVT